MTLRPRNGTVTKRRLLGLLVAVPAVAVGIGATASAATPSNGCPAGFESLSVVQAESEGPYVVARIVDETGNNDGYVCRRLLGDGVAHKFLGRPDNVYLWLDNSLL